jgi:hypothetical protein
VHLVAFNFNFLNDLLLIDDTILPLHNQTLRNSLNLRSDWSELVGVVLLSVDTLLLNHLFVFVPESKQLLKVRSLHSGVIGAPLIAENSCLLVYLSVKVIA